MQQQKATTPDPDRGARLTIGRGGPQLAGRLCHVLCQQLPIGDPRGHFPVQLLIQELLHSGTCGETAAKATGLFSPTQGWKPRGQRLAQGRACPWGAWPGGLQNICSGAHLHPVKLALKLAGPLTLARRKPQPRDMKPPPQVPWLGGCQAQSQGRFMSPLVQYGFIEPDTQLGRAPVLAPESSQDSQLCSRLTGRQAAGPQETPPSPRALPAFACAHSLLPLARGISLWASPLPSLGLAALSKDLARVFSYLFSRACVSFRHFFTSSVQNLTLALRQRARLGAHH